MKTIKYYLLLRDPRPLPKKTPKARTVYNWSEIDDGPSLNKIRKAAQWFEEHGEKIKIIREVTEITTVKSSDMS